MVNANDAIGQTFMLHKRTWSGAHRLIIAGRASLDQKKKKKSKPNQKEKKKVYYFLVMLFGLWPWRGCWSHLRMGSISIKHYVVVVWSLGSRPDGVSIAAAPSLYEKKKNAVVCCCRWKSSSSADKSGAAFWLSLAGHRGAKQPIHLISSREFFPLAHRGGLRRRLLVFFFFFLFYRGFIQPLTHTLPNAHKKHNRNIVSCLAAL